jgi:manganese/zinc-transporting P-type ATPase C
MAEVLVRSAAAGRVRLTVPWLKARPGCAGLVDDRLAELPTCRAFAAGRPR